MSRPEPLSPKALYRPCDATAFEFASTEELEDIEHALGQDRAVDAIKFGIGIEGEGYNVFAVGPLGTGKYTSVKRIVTAAAATREPASDWCYIYRFDQPNRPRAVRLPAGTGRIFRRDVEHLTDDLCCTVPSVYHGKKTPALKLRIATIKEIGEDNGRFDDLVQIGEVAKFTTRAVRTWRWLCERLFDRPNPDRDPAKRLKTVQGAVANLIHGLEQRYVEYEDVGAWLRDLREYVREHLPELVDSQQTDEKRLEFLRRFRVEVLVDNGDATGAPVVHEPFPTLQNLVGHIDTSPGNEPKPAAFEPVRSGALHRANGGFLLLDAHKLYEQQHAWQALKIALRSGEIRVDASERRNPARHAPQAIPLELKVILYGERDVYFDYWEQDREMRELFKVTAEFELAMPRDADREFKYARLVASIARLESLRPLDARAVARVIEQSARMVGDAEKLSTHQRRVRDLLREANYWASQRGEAVINAADVQKALDQQDHRADRMRDWSYEDIQRGFTLIATRGEAIGTINGLLVYQQNSFPYGKPTRITATVRPGRGRVLDIERETRLGGAIHSKGVLILASLLGSRYAPEHPLSIAASLVFEQSYGPVDGDSASMAELCAILSALADAPIAQSFAITGSVNQHGQAQYIGAVNVKIEGFFDVCKAQGLTGEQGVIIPAANIKHLMLRQDVVAAAQAGKFRIYGIENLDQALELLTGQPAGERGADGRFPADTINARVAERLAAFAHRCDEAGHADA